MRTGYKPFQTVDEYIRWYFRSQAVLETANRNNVDDQGLQDILMDLSMRQFLREPEIDELFRAWESRHPLNLTEPYYKLWIALEIHGWLCDSEVYKTIIGGANKVLFPDKRTITCNEFAEILEIKPRHVYRLISDGKIPPNCYTRIGGSGEYRLIVDEIKELVADWARRAAPMSKEEEILCSEL